MTRLFRLSLALAVLTFTAALRAGTPVADGIRDGVFHTGNGAEPRSLDPQINVAFTDTLITQTLFEGLVLKDAVTAETVPGVAERWETSEDGLTWTFHLRKNAKWSDGVPVTAQDFVWSYQRNLSPKLGTEYSYMLWVVDGAEAYTRQEDPSFPADKRITDFDKVGIHAKDDHTLVLRLAGPTPYLLSLIVHDSWMPVPRHVIEKFGSIDTRATGWDRPGSHVGNGAFKLTEWAPNKVIRVDKNPQYWDAANVGLNAICFYPIEDTTSEERSYLAGQLHRTYKVLPDSIERFSKERKGELFIEPWLETYFIRFNVQQPPLDNPLVRQALSAVIDREAIVENVTKGGQLAAYHFTPTGTGGFEARARVAYDPTAGRELLAKAGFPGGKGFPKLTLTYNTDPENTRILQAIQEMWRAELGVDIQLSNMEFKSYIEAMTKIDFQLLRSRWIGDYDDPNTYLGLFVTDGGNNNTHWSNKDYDRLIAEAGTTADAKARFELFQKAEELLLKELPVSPVFFGTQVTLRHPSVRGYAMTPTGQVIYKRIRLQ